ncbi:MAG: DNA replication/repair protein RecF [Gracilibacteraceae bacterium]|jgi:DNA replication and repair protein RecF|nr:DNA replication/repair protein RecF [Gracilibacteraceae bacterium]
MRINSLILRNFRNYRRQELDFGPAINVLSGQNGQGKTNVLESVFFLLTGKSQRIRQEIELVTWGEDSLYLSGEFTVRERRIQIESFVRANQRAVRLNGVPCRRMSDYVGLINAVFFTPDDLEIVKKGPMERRRFIDFMICQSKPAHIAALNQYQKALKQKSALLRRTRGDDANLRALLESWNLQLAAAGTKIISHRLEYVVKLQAECQAIFSVIFSADWLVEMTYISMGRRLPKEETPDLAAIFSERMGQEIERRAVLAGPHRDDILIAVNEKPAKIFASQGQQRALVLSMKLAEMEIFRKEKEEYPLLLLDDVLSELDEKRRGFLLDYINAPGRQTLITMTERDARLKGKETVFYSVKGGRAERE